MARTQKIAITVDADLLAQAERLRVKTAESRSAVFARALRELSSSEERRRQVERYVQTYREQPETLAEIEAAARTAHDVLRHVPWRGR